MIDAEGFRANVGIIICNKQGQLLWTRRYGQTSWQFPQGGVHPGESAEQTMYRELYEEVGLEKDDVRILGSTQHWYKYRLPPKLIRQNSKPLCIGQKQKWFLLELTAGEDKIDFNATDHPEFDDFIWVNYWYPVRHVVNFKRDVYRQALAELIHSMFKFQLHGQASHQPRKQHHKKQGQQNQSKGGYKSNPNQNRKPKRKPRHPYRSNMNQEQKQDRNQ